MTKIRKAGNFRREGSSRLGSVQFSAPPLPADEKSRLLALIKKQRQFIREHPNYEWLCQEAKSRIRYYQRQLCCLRSERIYKIS